MKTGFIPVEIADVVNVVNIITLFYSFVVFNLDSLFVLTAP